MDDKMINRINELAHLAKQRALTPEETEERAKLRKAYLADFRAGMQQTLEHTVVQYPDGTKVPVTKKK